MKATPRHPGDRSRGTICRARPIRSRALADSVAPEPEVMGLLALMLLQDSRRAARTSTTGDLILLERSGSHAVESRSDRGGIEVG